MDLRRAFDLFVRRAPLVALAVAAAIGAAYGAWRLVPPSYTASALLHVPTSPVDTDWRQYDLGFADRLMNTYVSLAESQRATTEVARRLRLDEPPSHLALELVANTELMRAVARGPTPRAAADAANALAAVLIGFGDELGSAAAANRGPPAPRIVEPAVAPDAPRGPTLPLLLTLAGIAGLGVGALLALIAENVDRRVFDLDLIAHVTRLPVLATVPRFSAKGKHGLAGAATPAGRAYRQLRTHLIATHGGAAPASVLVVGAERGDGASTTVANLARAFADAGHFAVVVDCDPEPSQRELLGLATKAYETTEAPHGTVAGSRFASTAIDGVRLVRARPRVAGRIKEDVDPRNTTLVLDSLPLADAGDGLLLSEAADAVVLVVRRGRTSVDTLVHAREALSSVHARVVGVVVNRAKPNRTRSLAYAAPFAEANASPRSRLEEPTTEAATEAKRA